MTDSLRKTRSAKPGRPPRVWPGLVIVGVIWLAITLPARVSTSGMTAPGVMEGVIAGALGGTLAFLVWWLAFSRVPWGDRWRGLAMVIAALVAGLLGGFHPYMRAMPVAFYLLPSIMLAAVVGMLLTQPMGWRRGRWLVLVAALAPILVWGCLRSNGMSGYLAADFRWRWTPTSEEAFLASRQSDQVPADPAKVTISEPLRLATGDWPEFRGPARDGRLIGVELGDDWNANPPHELWRRDVGPGWGSFCVVGENLFTQEQRGEEECVVCYDARTGDERWVNRIDERFEESTAGAGPRGTPTFDDGFLCTTGGSGVVQKLDARTGELLWLRRLIDDTPMEAPPAWGFASSPLVWEKLDGGKLVIVYSGDPETKAGPYEAAAGKAVIAYDSETGEPVWRSGTGFHGYGSPHLATLRGVEQVIVTSNAGAESLDPATGAPLWFYEWPVGEFPRIVQPLVRGDDTVIVATGYGAGTHAIGVDRDGDTWTTNTLWQSKELKPYFNDLVEHAGYLYGFDGKFLTCIDPETGESMWPKRARRDVEFGQGQVLLVEDSGLLVVTTELTGEVVLLRASPDAPELLARIPAVEGKTWNHPVIAHGKLFVRNGSAMVCFELDAQPSRQQKEGPLAADVRSARP